MEFPKKMQFKVGTKPTTVKVRCTKRPPQGWVRASDGKDRGMMEWESCHVWVERDDNYAVSLSTLLHEVLHVLMESENLLDDLNILPDNEEDIVGGLEKGLMTFLTQPEVAAIISRAASIEAVE